MPRRGKRRIEIGDLFRLRVVTGADISPDGERIVFALQRQDLKKNKAFSSLYLVPAAGGRMRRLTRGDHSDSVPKFSPDGRTVAFLSNREKGMALWLLPMDGGEPKRITDRDGVVIEHAWSPDGKRLAVSYRKLTAREKLVRDEKREQLARMPDFRHVTRLFYKMDGEGFRSKERAHIHLVRVSGGRMSPLTGGAWDDFEPRFSPAGDRVSFVSNRVEDPDLFLANGDIYTVGLDGRGLRKVTRERGPAFGHIWAPDGRSIYYLGHLGGPGEWNEHHIHLRRAPAGGGKSRDLTPDFDRMAMNTVIGDVVGTSFSGPPPLLTEDGERILFAATEEGASRLAVVPVSGGTPEWVLGTDHTVFGFGLAQEGGGGFVLSGDLANPADLHRLTLAPEGGGRTRRLTVVNDRALRGIEVVVPEEVRYRRPGGKVHGWVLKPPGFRKGSKYPVVLEIHGGPHVAYGQVFFHEMQLLAAQGYVVLMTNPRGSDGYGLEHRMAIRADWGNVDAKDLMAALDGLVAEGYVDRERQFVTGGSYGGYMTNWLVGHTDRFRAAATQRSVVNMSSFFGTSDFGYLFQHEFDGTPWEAEESYKRMSPLTYARNVKTPLLVIHSETDHRCPIGQAEELFATLKIMGKEVEMVRFAGESHGLSRGGRPQNRAERLRRILDWFRRHGGR